MSFGTFAIGTAPHGGGTGGSSIVYYDITLVDPVDSSTASSFYPTFTSLPNSSDGSVMQIEWQWDKDPDFTNSTGARQAKTTLAAPPATNATTVPDTALYNGPYYWRARAGDGTSWSSYTATWQLSVLALSTYSSAYAYENVGLPPTPPTKDGTSIAFVNTGVAPGTPLAVTRYPRGWGIMASGPQTVIILDESSAGTAEAYEYVV